MLAQDNQKNRGDTLIEVLFAVAVFSFIAVGGLSIMNQGMATSQRALEISLVRNEIDSQAETLRFLNASYVSAYQTGVNYSADTPAGQWSIITSNLATTDNASDFSMSICPSSSASLRSNSFILNTRSAKVLSLSATNFESAKTFSQVIYNNKQVSIAEGVWIEAVKSNNVVGNNQSNSGYIDFNIRACWDSPGQKMPVTIGTIVRLYEPRG